MTYYKNLEIIEEKDKIIKKEENFLDTIDIENYLKHDDWSVLKIMSEIQEDHGTEYKEESYIFNAINIDDFIDYVSKRYKSKYKFYMYSEIRVEQKA